MFPTTLKGIKRHGQFCLDVGAEAPCSEIATGTH
jgi:hypothetical protein